MADPLEELAGGEPLFRIKDATKKFDGLTAVENVSFDVQRAKIVGVIGPNGAGKSTLFNLISGLMPLTHGSMSFRGRALDRVPAYERSPLGMARTFQIVRLFTHMTVLENIMIGGHPKMREGFVTSILQFPSVVVNERELRHKALAKLDFVGLSDRAGHEASHLPHGQQRLVEIARALLSEPILLLLDEPAAGLNGRETAELFRMLRELNSQGMTILVVEHDMKFIMSLCDRIIVLDHGAKISEGRASEIQQDERVIEAYLGRKHSHAEN
jgi:branched-chain amino acid transport system ATP-binding protein